MNFLDQISNMRVNKHIIKMKTIKRTPDGGIDPPAPKPVTPPPPPPAE